VGRTTSIISSITPLQLLLLFSFSTHYTLIQGQRVLDRRRQRRVRHSSGVTIHITLTFQLPLPYRRYIKISSNVAIARRAVYEPFRRRSVVRQRWRRTVVLIWMIVMGTVLRRSIWWQWRRYVWSVARPRRRRRSTRRGRMQRPVVAIGGWTTMVVGWMVSWVLVILRRRRRRSSMWR